MKKVFVIYLPIVLLTLLVSLPFIFPARLLATALIPQLLATPGQQSDQQDLGLTNLQGALSAGSADVFLDSQPLGLLSWTTELASLLNGDIKLRLKLAGDDHLLEAIVVTDTRRVTVEDLRGYVRAASVNPLSVPYGITLEGELKLLSINLQLENQWLQQLSGNLSWNGGTIRYRAANAAATYRLNALSGELSLPEQTAILQVRDTYSAAEVLSVHLTAQGWATATILRRFFDLAGMQWIITDSADDIALQLEQKLW